MAPKAKVKRNTKGRVAEAKSTKKDKGAKRATSVLREDCFRILDEKNRPLGNTDPKLSKALMLNMYRNMVLTRTYDERGMMLQRQGRIGFYVPSFGQEAIQTATAAALEDADWVFPSYREPGVFLYRGAKVFDLLCNLYGNKADLCKGRQMPVHYSVAEKNIVSVSSPIATQVVQAVGAAMASKLRREKQIAISYFGDGATSETDFHTGLTFAGAYQAPCVFICTNNQYAISVPLAKQTAAKRLADKAIGYGMPGIAVDGNDILAVYQATKDAVDRARKGEGPSLIECVTFRMGPHSSSDDPTRYRDEALYQAWKLRDPILRFRQYLEDRKLWDEERDLALQEELKAMVIAEIDRAEAQPPPAFDDLFTDVFAQPTYQLEKQRKQFLEEAELRGRFENTSEAFPL